jgi:hypothetical protein
MPGPVASLPFNRYPAGLLGLLDAKVRGQTPNELAQVTYPTVDITQFLLAQGAEAVNDLTAAIGAVGRFFGTALSLVVPNDELWYVHACATRPSAALGAATSYQFKVIHDTALALGASPQCLFVRSDTASGTTAGQPFAGNGKPFIMSPGDRLGVFVESGPFGVPATFQVHGLFTRLRI